MEAAGLSVADLAAKTQNRKTGKSLTANAVAFWLCYGPDGTGQTPSLESWIQLAEIFPGLSKPERFTADEQNAGRADVEHETPSVALTPKTRQDFTASDDRAIVIVDGRAYFEGDEPSAEAAQ